MEQTLSQASEQPEVLFFENYDLENVVTPVNVEQLSKLLKQTNYDKVKSEFLIQGFTHGFDIGYRGDTKIKRTAPNLRLFVGSKIELWNKVMGEVKLKRFAGPFEKIPFEHYIQSPIGLVPKDGGVKTRLIFHLSHPRTGKARSMNACTPKNLSSVEYSNFDDAIELCLQLDGKNPCYIAKSDMDSAFKNLGIRKDHWYLLILKADNLKDRKTYIVFCG